MQNCDNLKSARITRISRIILGVMAFTLCIAACSDSRVNVAVHGLNYTDQPFSYGVFADEKAIDGIGETISAFAAGGTICCFALPTRWHNGLSVRVKTTHWQARDRDGFLPEVSKVQVLAVPRYEDGNPGELWIIRGRSGNISVVTSHHDPSHARWPATDKGWPVSSLSYRRMRWDIYIEQARSNLETAEELVNRMEKSPLKAAADSWGVAERYDKGSIQGYSGPTDPKYISDLREQYRNELIQNKSRFEKLQKSRP